MAPLAQLPSTSGSPAAPAALRPGRRYAALTPVVRANLSRRRLALAARSGPADAAGSQAVLSAAIERAIRLPFDNSHGHRRP